MLKRSKILKDKKKKEGITMTITYELDLEFFEAWSGGEITLSRVINEGKVSTLETILEDCYPDGMTETHLNDILRFEDEWVYEMCGIRSEEKIREEIKEAKERLEEIYEEYNDALAEEIEKINSNREIRGWNELDEEEIAELGIRIFKDYMPDVEEIKEEIAELEEELENI